ncbi:dipeptide transport system permease protein (DPPB) related protein [Thermoplasma acidophilum]|uniref:Dipeptide transport system permease protein (DPPB) related protein n=2 Tax=Thermoplasma acidophilum TaxID=2303 RepID=Q9HLG5_THEAC|nr:ABC transporter permease [Thermoplasma acidophilum]AAF28766.1 putative ABC transporter AbcA1 [Thermoplasma acidophilum]CAC11408.1 dipeptide transport system permease protein (DPPB) related protein [Thermoplasma acidophilum]
MDSRTLAFIIRRAIYAIFTLLILIVFIFTLIHIIAPNPLALARLYAGNPHASQSELIGIEKKYGLNLPIYDQVINYIKDVFIGNLGYDYLHDQPVLKLIGEYLPITLEFVLTGIVLSVIIGLFTGAYAAARRRKPADYTIKGLYLATWSMPTFLLAAVLQLYIAYDLKLLPATGMVNPTLKPPPNVLAFPLLNAIYAHDWVYASSVIHHMILPTLSVALLSFGVITRLTRSTMLDIMDMDYFRLTIMKGIPRRKAVYGVALRNAAIPLVTYIVLAFAYAMGGAVVIEDIFSYHGMGYYIVQAVYNLDYPGILGTTIIIAIAVIVANLVADVLYGILDPRVRLE